MEPVKLFYSYSHKDEGLREELVNHLTSLERQGVLAPWHDRDIEAGAEWNQEIERHLNESQIILLKPAERARYAELAVFPEDVNIPLATLEKFWGKTGEPDNFLCR